jgi:hypothetical protein
VSFIKNVCIILAKKSDYITYAILRANGSLNAALHQSIPPLQKTPNLHPLENIGHNFLSNFLHIVP